MQVLVSVNSVQEAHMALSAGVPLLDLKETSYGALAALDLDRSSAIMDEVNTFRRHFPQANVVVSATIGDDCKSTALLTELIESRTEIGIDVIKLPETIWANEDYHPELKKQVAGKIKLIAVLTPAKLENKVLANALQQLAEFGYWGVMVDTIEKSQPLTTMVSLDILRFFATTAKSLGLYVGLAGGLRLEQFDELAGLAPDYLGFRSGVSTDQQREQPLEPEKIRMLVAKLSEIC